jgi:hypothetical protein
VDRDQDELQLDLFVLHQIDGQWRIVDGLADLDPDELPAT